MKRPTPVLLLAVFLSLPIAAQAGVPHQTLYRQNQARVTPVQSPGTATSEVVIKIPKDAMGKGPSAYGENPKVIQPGTKVTWVNDDSVAHTVTSDSGVFDSSFIMPGKSWSHVFTQAGTYPYYCTLHGKQTMAGTIKVTG